MYKPNCKQEMDPVISPLNISPPPACEINLTCYDILKLKKAIIIQKFF